MSSSPTISFSTAKHQAWIRTLHILEAKDFNRRDKYKSFYSIAFRTELVYAVIDRRRFQEFNKDPGNKTCVCIQSSFSSQSEDVSSSDPWSVCVDESVAAAVASGANGTSRHVRRCGSRRTSQQEDALLDDDEINGTANSDQNDEVEEEEDDEEADEYTSNAPPSFLNLELTLPSAVLPPNDATNECDSVDNSMRHLRLFTEPPRKHSSPELSTTSRPGAALGTRTNRRSGRLKSLIMNPSVEAATTSQLPFLVSGVSTSSSSGDHPSQTSEPSNMGGTVTFGESRELSFLTSKTGARRRRKLSAKTRRSSAAAATLASSSGATVAAAVGNSRTAARVNPRTTNTNNNHDSSSSTATTEERDDMSDFTESFVRLSAFTRSLGRFSRIGYPDLIGSQPTTEKVGRECPVSYTSILFTRRVHRNAIFFSKEVFADRSLGTQQTKVMDDMRRIVECEDLINKVVFDLDQIVARDRNFYNCAYSRIANEDETK